MSSADPLHSLADVARGLALAAGTAVLEVYADPAGFDARIKGDGMVWDTAAAQAVVEAAGAVVWRYGTRGPLRYDACVLRNQHFLAAFGDDAPVPDAYRPLEVP